MPIKINIKNVIVYVIYTAVLLCFNLSAKGLPLGAALCLAMLVCGSNLWLTPLLYVAASVVHLHWVCSLIALAEATILCVITLIYRKTRRKMRWEAVLWLAISLVPFILFWQWQGINDLLFTTNPYLIKTILSLAVPLFYVLCFQAVFACIYRLYRARLKTGEILCLAVLYCVAGVGLYRVTGAYCFYCLLFFSVLFGVRVIKNASAVILACVLSAPACLCSLSFTPLTVCVVLSVLTLCFCTHGAWVPSVIGAPLAVLFFYLQGYFYAPPVNIVLRALLLLCAAVAVSLPREQTLITLYEKLTCKTHLPQAEIAHFKLQTGEKLYRLSQVFREIEQAFYNMDEDVDEVALRHRMLQKLKQTCCKNCPRKGKCNHTNVYNGFSKLIQSGCMKGKVNLIDLPADVTANCTSAAEVIAALNQLLADYRRYMTEAENARMGRKLLANQARGVANVMKTCAVEVSKRTANRYATEQKLINRLAVGGVTCTELTLKEEQTTELTLAVLGNHTAAHVGKILSEALQIPLTLKDKLPLAGDVSLLTYAQPPAMDATFGVAYAIKDGESTSGDTHSVIRINEHCFLMVLSDGMGSGDYARKVSATAISLIEAFYRAGMPEDTVLDTINQLLSFNREERFACIDITAVNLNTGRANFVKIGSPVGVIVRDGEIRVLESQSLPLGILDNLKPSTCAERLQAGDIITFMSDGITSAFGSTPELCEFLQTLHPKNPQGLADSLLQGALARNDGKVPDDMTVVCTRLF